MLHWYTFFCSIIRCVCFLLSSLLVSANFNQGWPKLAHFGVFFTTGDGGVAIGVYAPSKASYPDGTSVEIDTTYPFEDVIRIMVNSTKDLPLHLRVPAWAHNATIFINGPVGIPGRNGTMNVLHLKVKSSSFFHFFF